MTTGDLSGNYGISELFLAIKIVFGDEILIRIKSKSYTQSDMVARKVFSVILMTEFGLSDNGVASLIGRNRTTVINYRKSFMDWERYDKKFSELLKSVKYQAGVLHE